MRFKWLFLILIPLSAHALPGFFSPWGKDADLKYNETCHPVSPPSSWAVSAAEHVIRFHQEILSPVDGPRSHFRPSSSNYMKIAMQKHGFLTGFFMGCDRLMRENADPWVYKTIEENGIRLKYDPVK